MSTHPPRHRLEELAVDAYAGGDGGLREHVEACARCSERLQSFRAARAAFHTTRDPAAFARGVVAQRRKPARHFVWLGSVTVAAAAALLLMRSPAIRLKGGHTLQVFVQHAGQTRELVDGQALAEGDQLAFTYSLPEARHLLLLSIDDEGNVSRYFPREAGEAQIAAAARAQLPVGIELDDHHGEERLIALFSRAPLDESRARQAVRDALQEAKARGRGIADMKRTTIDAEQVSLWFRKP